MSVDQLSDYLGLKKNTIYQYVFKNKIPYKKIPGSSKLIFSRSEVDAWIEGGDFKNGDIERTSAEIW